MIGVCVLRWAPWKPPFHPTDSFLVPMAEPVPFFHHFSFFRRRKKAKTKERTACAWPGGREEKTSEHVHAQTEARARQSPCGSAWLQCRGCVRALPYAHLASPSAVSIGEWRTRGGARVASRERASRLRGTPGRRTRHGRAGAQAPERPAEFRGTERSSLSRVCEAGAEAGSATNGLTGQYERHDVHCRAAGELRRMHHKGRACGGAGGRDLCRMHQGGAGA